MKVDLWPVDGTPLPTTTPSRGRRFLEHHLPSVVIYLMVATLVAVVLYPHMVVTVPSGQVGVLWKRFGGGTVLDPRKLKSEGFNLILPWNRVFLYDLRLQSFTESYNAISSDGVSLTATIIVRFRLQRDAVPVLHQAIGPNYEQVLVQPGIGSLTRQVIAEYTAEQAYSTARQEIQDKIRSLVEERLSEKMMEHAGEEGEESYRVSMSATFILYDILVTGIELPAAIVAAINRKTEQYYIAEEYKFRVEREKRESERKKIEAEGIRDFQQIVSQGISESYLRWRGIEATLQLSQSTNSKVVVIGSGKDGLPIILGNVDAPAQRAGSTTPDGNDNKERTTAASPAVPLEKTPAAALATPAEKIPPASSSTPSGTNPERSRSLWPISLSDIETYLTQMLLPTERKTEPRSRPFGPQ
jgi:regulator of protease activity HflC (stomatin/prohibitin superfamily)